MIGCDLEPFVFVYLDDIIVATEEFDFHFEVLEKLAKRITAAGLTISVSKSRFCMKSLKYLGYIVGEKGISPDPEKIAAIKNYAVPKNFRDVRRLFGLIGWYRRFILNFASITAPISALLKKNVTKFAWSSEAESAFRKIQVALTSAPILANPDYSKPFIVQTDASDIGMGAILVQGEGEEEKVVAFWSQKLNPAQRKYQTTERECLAVILAVEKFRPYIEGIEFTVITDHASLLWLRNLKDPTGRLGRWALRLQPYRFTLKHRKGRFMVVADALSRAVEAIDASSSVEDAWYDKIKLGVIESPDNFPEFRIVEGELQKKYRKGQDGHVYQPLWRTLVHRSNRIEILRQNHDDPRSAHGGYLKTADRVKKKYFWPKMDIQIRKYVRGCEVCKASKPTNEIQRSPMGNFRSASRPWEIVYIDFIGPLPRSKTGFCYVLVVLDGFSKFVHIHPMRDATAKAAVKCLKEHLFLVYGTPRFLVSDNGSQFTAKLFKEFLSEYDVQSWYTARYHPQANAAEAANKTLETAVRAYLKDEKTHKNWDEYLPEIACAMNTAQHTSTMLSPYFTLYGLHMCTSGKDYVHSHDPHDAQHADRMTKIRKIVIENLKRNYERSKKRYNLRSREIHYAVGDVVWVKNRVLSNAIRSITAKLSPEYKKCVIARKIGTNSYEIAEPGGKIIGIYNTDCFKS